MSHPEFLPEAERMTEPEASATGRTCTHSLTLGALTEPGARRAARGVLPQQGWMMLRRDVHTHAYASPSPFSLHAACGGDIGHRRDHRTEPHAACSLNRDR